MRCYQIDFDIEAPTRLGINEYLPIHALLDQFILDLQQLVHFIFMLLKGALSGSRMIAFAFSGWAEIPVLLDRNSQVLQFQQGCVTL
jgi:hypothetical protein